MLGLREKQRELLEHNISEGKGHGMPRDALCHMASLWSQLEALSSCVLLLFQMLGLPTEVLEAQLC